MEESTEQILSTLAVIHRFMSAHTTFQDNIQGSSANVHEPLRLRTVSETENENTLTIVITYFLISLHTIKNFPHIKLNQI